VSDGRAIEGERGATPGPLERRVTIDVYVDGDGRAGGLEEDARAGFRSELKELPPKYFYDERGSRLFERITELPEYYPTRAERAILEREATAIVAAAEPECLVELGSGSASKTRSLLDAMRDAGSLHTYVPVDISEEITRETAARLVAEYPGLRVHGVICDFTTELERLPGAGQRRTVAFLGGTIGNFAPAERASFLSRIAGVLRPGDHLLLGTDLVKDRGALEAAYNDSAGVTAEFNKNLLRVLNRELGADFDPDAFEHRAFYDEGEARIDLRLRSLAEQVVTLPALEMRVAFEHGEEIRTEISCKFTRESIHECYTEAGLELVRWWTDPEDQFALSLARLL
jgi:L-histidine N-alpha-methyltransferase